MQGFITVFNYTSDIRYSSGLHVTQTLVSSANTDNLDRGAVFANFTDQGFDEFGTNIESYQILIFLFASAGPDIS